MYKKSITLYCSYKITRSIRKRHKFSMKTIDYGILSFEVDLPRLVFGETRFRHEQSCRSIEFDNIFLLPSIEKRDLL